MMNVLVTGGTGMVGYGLKRYIQSSSNLQNKFKFIFLSSAECDLTNYDKTIAFFKKTKPDYVIHLAACVGGLYRNMNFKVDMYEKNTLINYNVLKCSHDLGVKKVVSCLSTCIFPDKTSYPINEKMLHNGPPHSSNDAYAYSKRMLEIHSKAYQEQYGDNFICVIPTNIYGENDNYSLEDGHVIPALIHKCYIAKENGEKFVVRGTGKPLRQFIYAYDLARLLMWVLESYHDKESIILSVNEDDEVSIKDIATLIAKEFKYEHMMEFDSTYSDGQFKKTSDNSKLMNLNPNFEFTKMEDGMKKSVKWFIEHFEECRK